MSKISSLKLPALFSFLPNSTMSLSTVLAVALLASQVNALPGRDRPLLRRACPDYVSYSSTPQ